MGAPVPPAVHDAVLLPHQVVRLAVAEPERQAVVLQPRNLYPFPVPGEDVAVGGDLVARPVKSQVDVGVFSQLVYPAL